MNAALAITLPLAPDHPALAGHFPGYPLYPGVVLLDVAIAAIESHFNVTVAGLPGVKFLAPVHPGAALQLQAERQNDAVRFELSVGADLVAKGSVRVLSAGDPAI